MKSFLNTEFLNPSDAMEHWQNVRNVPGINRENRTTLFGVYNETPFDVELAYGQMKAGFSGGGYIDDTGVFVFCTPHPNSRPCVFDPIVYGEKIAANTGSFSMLFTNGAKVEDEYPVISDPNKYYDVVTWTVSLRSNTDEISINRQESIRTIPDLAD